MVRRGALIESPAGRPLARVVEIEARAGADVRHWVVTARAAGRLAVSITTVPDPEGEPTISWSADARRAMAELTAQLEEASASLGGSVALTIWPRAGDVLSDVPSVLTFLRRESGLGRPGWSLVLDPGSLLTPSMRPSLDDHLDRLFESLAPLPALWAIASDAPGWLPEGEREAWPEWLRRRAERAGRSGGPWIVTAGEQPSDAGPGRSAPPPPAP